MYDSSYLNKTSACLIYVIFLDTLKASQCNPEKTMLSTRIV